MISEIVIVLVVSYVYFQVLRTILKLIVQIRDLSFPKIIASLSFFNVFLIISLSLSFFRLSSSGSFCDLLPVDVPRSIHSSAFGEGPSF